jgi:tetratricopeptide (TPR) repeat protein
VLAPISSFFLSGSSIEETRESRSNGSQLSPPAYDTESRQRLKALLQKIRSADQLVTWRSDLDRFIEFHRSFAEKTGDAYLLVRGFGEVSYEILKQNFQNQEASRAIEMLLLEGLRWEPENEYFWGFWAQAYISVGHYAAAEYIFWENLRRHPHSMHGRSMFAEFLASFLGRIDEAIVIARDALSISPDDLVIRNALAKYLLWDDSSESIIKALELFTDSSEVLKDSYARNVFAKAILKFFESESDPTRFRNVIERLLPYDSEHLGGLGFMLARLPGGSEAAIAFLEIAVERFPTNVTLRNRLARVLAATMDPQTITRAIELLHTTLEFQDNEFTRNQLAQCLLAKGDNASLLAAIELIRDTEEKFGVTKYAEELKKLAAKPNPSKLAKVLLVPGSRSGVVEPSTMLTKLDSVIQGSLSKPVPDFIVRWGATRKLRFEIENGSDQQRDHAKQRIREIIATNPTFAYARLLAERHQLWEGTVVQRPIFVTAFERALRTNDAQGMGEIASRYPRWAPLAMIARALMGNAASAEQISSLFLHQAGAASPAIEVLRKAVNPLLACAEDPAQIISLAEHRSKIVLALYDANEATIGEFALAAAA